MYYPQAYKDKTKAEIIEDVKREGFSPLAISDDAGFVYDRHQHPETKLLVFLEGTMDVITEGETYHCIPGDKLIIPGNTLHEAVVGNGGCTFLWSEKIL